MTKIPPKVLKEILADPDYKFCMKAGIFDHVCDGRVTFDHAVIYGSKQVQKKWAIISVCEKGHSVGRYQDAGDHNREVHLWIALNRATSEEILEISKVVPYTREKMRLNEKYGKWEMQIQYPKEISYAA